MRDRLRRLLPTRDSLRENRWLRWLGPALYHPRLWHMSRRGIALGVAIGVFFGLLIPIAQIPLSAALAVALRANVPTAMASTLVTNPVTFPPVYYAAWRVGSALLGQPGEPAPAPAPAPVAAPEEPVPPPGDSGWFARTVSAIGNVGKPLLLGLAIFACVAGLAAYVLIDGLWRLRVSVKRARRQRRRRTGADAGAG